MSKPDPNLLEKLFRPRLLEERHELEAQSQDTSGERAPVALDQQSVGRLSRIDALQAQAMAQASDRRRQVRRAQVAAALERMDEGEFGYCVACGNFIGLERLKVDPATPRCIACARAAEG